MLKLRTFFILFPVLFILSACSTDVTPDIPTGELTTEATGVGLEFRVDPETQEVTVVEPEIATLQAQADGDIRLLVQGQDIRFKDFSFQFKSPNRLVVRLRVENITDDLNFTQPFFFTLSSTSRNIVTARAPLVTDAQLGGDGVLSPGETSKRFRFVVTFKEDEPFTFFVDARAAVVKSSACVGPVSIPSEDLEVAIRRELNKPEGDLSCEDLALLRELDPFGDYIPDLEGLQYAVNLTSLNLDYSFVSDISLLANLTHLADLSLLGNSVSDLSPLAKLTNLTALDLGANPVDDISTLENLTKLTFLNLGASNLSDSDLSSLSNLVNLTSLTLSGDDITDISSFENLTKLTYLDLGSNVTLSDISPLEGLTDLTFLDLNSNNISDVDPLGNLTKLTFLDLDENNIGDLSALSSLVNLTFLDLVENKVSDIGPLGNLISLRELKLDYNRVSSIQALESLDELSELDLFSNNVSDLSPLENLANLRFLDLGRNTISDISALVNNSGINGEGVVTGDIINLRENPLSAQAREDVETLRARGVSVGVSSE